MLMKTKRRFYFLLYSFCSLLWSVPASAQYNIVTMQTAKSIGSKMEFRVNYTPYDIWVDWGNGIPRQYKMDAGTPSGKITGTVEGRQISIACNGLWHSLSCNNNELTSINLSGATSLSSLFCQNNELPSLSLKGMRHLRELDCSGNKISSLVFSSKDKPENDIPLLEKINLADNLLTGTFHLPVPQLQFVDISNNAIERIYVTSNVCLSTLYCSNNKLKAINMKRNPNIETVVCHGNQLEYLFFPDNHKLLKQLVCDDNLLSEISLPSSAGLTDISCGNNALKSLQLSSNAKLSSLNVSHNALTLACLPEAKNKPLYHSFAPQEAFSCSHIEGMAGENDKFYAPVAASWNDRLSTTINLKPLEVPDSKPTDTTYRLFAINDDNSTRELVDRKAEAESGDFYVRQGKMAFFTSHPKVFITMQSNTYGYTLSSTPFAVGNTTTGITDSSAANPRLTVRYAGGTLIVDAPAATRVQLRGIDGKLVYDSKEKVSSAQIHISRGCYILNNKKIIF